MYRQSGPINHPQQASIQNENNILGKLAKDLCNIRSFKFQTFTKIEIFKVYLAINRPSASAL